MLSSGWSRWIIDRQPLDPGVRALRSASVRPVCFPPEKTSAIPWGLGIHLSQLSGFLTPIQNARNHGSPERRVWRKIHLGIDEETLEVRAVNFTGSHIRDAPVLPDLLCQIQPDRKIGGVTAPSRQIASQSPAGQWTVPVTLVSAATRSLTAGRLPSSQRAETPSRGRPSRRVRSPLSPDQWRTKARPKTRPCEHQNISAARSGETGAATTAEAALGQGCPA